jgi:hypothetical protein
MTREEIINEIKCILSELDNGEDAVSYLTQNDVKWLNENIKALEQQSCEDAISRSEALKTINNMDIPEDMCTFEIMSHIGVEIGTLPPVQPKSKTGHWIEERYDSGNMIGWHCSNCYDKTGFVTTCAWDFCPNCGSDNREVEE